MDLIILSVVMSFLRSCCLFVLTWRTTCKELYENTCEQKGQKVANLLKLNGLPHLDA
ncbi:hypothetical protein SAMN04488523_102308 [Sulfitobacter brevis]|uniref:Uncharacterized protein n=1 Tax=Sulfitobacter brevis TaxID=74348 RepID=A0A1I1UZQ8_9RHOB|nr:hypothetical protein SAMN04488523_102308 [Sulfitobacter brevis]